jgi:hypothetical protein
MSVVSTATRVVVFSAAAVLSITALSGCSVLQGLIPGGGDDVFSISVGDCWDDQDVNATEVSTVTSIDCAKPHDNEAYASVKLDDGDYPGDEALLNSADQGCYDEFQAFMGIAYEDSQINYTYFYPTTESWDVGDREILCFVYEDQTKVTGTLAGSAR